VLLKNRAGIQPLDRSRQQRIAVLGFGADPAEAGISGGFSADTTPFRATSGLVGLRGLCAGGIEVSHAEGPPVSPDGDVYEQSCFESERGAGLWGEYFNNNDLTGEPVCSRLDPTVNFFWGREPPAPGVTVRQYSIRWSGFLRVEAAGPHEFFSRCRNGHYRICIDGEPIIDTWERERNGMHRAELSLAAGRHAVSVEWRKTRMSGNMKFGFRPRRDVVPGLAECVELAQAADVAVACVGFDRVTESEGYDRSFALSDEVERMLRAVVEAQPNTLVVLTAGGNVDMSGWIDRAAAVLHAWYPGQAGGQAIAEILFGDVEPSGRLPASFEKRLEDGASFHSYHDDDGDRRVALTEGLFTGYRHFDARGIEPRFPFGFGLSYTRFELSDLGLSSRELRPGESLVVSATLRNVGDRRGAELVLAFVAELSPRLPRPPKALQAFSKVWLEPGESRRVELKLERRAFERFDPETRRWGVDPGQFEVLVGGDARDVRVAGRLRVG
jgi:beta-glucosidase